MRELLVRTLTLCVSAVLVVGLAGPSLAESRHNRDARRDVSTFDLTDPNANILRAPEHANGDLTGMKINYRSKRLTILLRFRQLDHTDPVLALGGTFQTSAGRPQDFVIRASKGHWKGRTQISGEKQCMIRHRIDYTHNRARISMPVSCVHRARWIKFQGIAVTTDDWRDPTYFFLDTAPGKDMFGEQFTARIHRG